MRFWIEWSKSNSKRKDLIATLASERITDAVLSQTRLRKWMKRQYKEWLLEIEWLMFVEIHKKKNVRENYFLINVANEACMSKAHFFEGPFKQDLGLNCRWKLLLHERLNWAKQYLQLGQFQFKKFAIVSGFRNIHLFHSASKQEIWDCAKVFSTRSC